MSIRATKWEKEMLGPTGDEAEGDGRWAGSCVMRIALALEPPTVVELTRGQRRARRCVGANLGQGRAARSVLAQIRGSNARARSLLRAAACRDSKASLCRPCVPCECSLPRRARRSPRSPSRPAEARFRVATRQTAAPRQARPAPPRVASPAAPRAARPVAPREPRRVRAATCWSRDVRRARRRTARRAAAVSA